MNYDMYEKTDVHAKLCIWNDDTDGVGHCNNVCEGCAMKLFGGRAGVVHIGNGARRKLSVA